VDNRGKPAQSQPRAGPTTAKKESSEFKEKEVELRGISEAIREERRKASACLKCGKSGHTWFKCYSKAPVTRSVASVSKKQKRKRDNDKDDNSAPKKAKVERVTADKTPASSAKAIKSRESPSPRIFEVATDSDAMSIYD
jgi:hypothetical protein